LAAPINSTARRFKEWPVHAPVGSDSSTIRYRCRGRQLVTLKDAADYIMKLPKTEQNLPEWQTAISCLIGAAEGRDFLMHAQIGMLRALNRNVERVFDPSRKDTPLAKTKAQERPVTMQVRSLQTCVWVAMTVLLALPAHAAAGYIGTMTGVANSGQAPGEQA